VEVDNRSNGDDGDKRDGIVGENESKS